MTNPYELSQGKLHEFSLVLRAGALVLFAYVLFQTAWVAEDAVISFRVIDNLLNGYGPVYNVGERVQVFTNPLFTFSLAILAFFTRELFYTGIAFSAILSIATVYILGWKIARSPLTGGLLILCLSMSFSFVDYSTSALENPMTHFLMALFYSIFFKNYDLAQFGRSLLIKLLLIVCLSILNRLDSIIFYLPALVVFFFNTKFKDFVISFLISFTPFIFWEIFSLMYYGYLLPNTVYAKLNLAIDSALIFKNGIFSIIVSMMLDPVLAFIVPFFGFAVYYQHKRERVFIQAGITFLIYLFMVINYGGDYMAGRFYTGIMLFLSIFLATIHVEKFRNSVCIMLFLICLLFNFSNPNSPISSKNNFGRTEETKTKFYFGGVVNERTYWYDLPDNKYALGMMSNLKSIKVHNFSRSDSHQIARVVPTRMAGIYCYDLDRNIYILDLGALCDPLLSKLPYKMRDDFRIGHYFRDAPAGYAETILTGEDRFKNKNLGHYYAKLKIIVRDPIFSVERFKTILTMNFGGYSHLLKEVN